MRKIKIKLGKKSVSRHFTDMVVDNVIPEMKESLHRDIIVECFKRGGLIGVIVMYTIYRLDELTAVRDSVDVITDELNFIRRELEFERK